MEDLLINYSKNPIFIEIKNKKTNWVKAIKDICQTNISNSENIKKNDNLEKYLNLPKMFLKLKIYKNNNDKDLYNRYLYYICKQLKKYKRKIKLNTNNIENIIDEIQNIYN